MLWGGRFKETLNNKALRFSSSISIDRDLLHEDIAGCKAHAKMLNKTGLISDDEFLEIGKGLSLIGSEYSSGSWLPDDSKFEDIHSAIESRLFELIGQTAGKLHTGRSRNDQVITAVRLWVKRACGEIIQELASFRKTLLDKAEQYTEMIIPGYTHLQRAQPISPAFHLLAYVEMVHRDIQRFEFTANMADECPLGSGALAGSTLPLDRHLTSQLLGFSHPSRNALDAVSDRDFMIEFLYACATGMMHLSRLSEELIIWSTAEWKLIRLSDSLTTGSSLMPQKKNPDMAELIRGKSGRVYGNLTALLTTLKGLPLSYNRDLQEDKESVFDSYSTYHDCVSIMGKMIETMELDTERFRNELKGDFSLATDLADWLVLKGIPFREAHHIVGQAVRYCEAKGVLFDALSIQDLKGINPVFDETALECLDINTALTRKKTFGSPNPDLVKEQIKWWKNSVRGSKFEV